MIAKFFQSLSCVASTINSSFLRPAGYMYWLFFPLILCYLIDLSCSCWYLFQHLVCWSGAGPYEDACNFTVTRHAYTDFTVNGYRLANYGCALCDILLVTIVRATREPRSCYSPDLSLALVILLSRWKVALSRYIAVRDSLPILWLLTLETHPHIEVCHRVHFRSYRRV